MESLRLKTCTGTHREVDLVNYAVWRRETDRVFDSIAENDDGTQTLYQRARRRAISIELDGIPQASVDILETMWRDRQECYLEGNVGENTRIYAPFESSKAVMVGVLGSFARASIATYMGDDGLIREVGSGMPRFEACKIGNGILLEMARTNYFYPSHGGSGATLWITDAGSPIVAWDVSMPSNVYGKMGTIRLELANATPDAVKTTVAGLTPSATYCAYVWAMGVGSIALSVTGATGTVTSGTKTLSMAWQLIAVEGFVATGTSVTLKITCVGADTRCWLSAHQVEAGWKYTSYIPTTGAAATRALDQWACGTVSNYAEGSVAFWLKFPRIDATNNDGTRILWFLNGGFYAACYPDGTLTFTLSGTAAITVTPATHGFTSGQIVHLAYVWKRDYAAIIANGVAIGTSTSNSRPVGSATAMQLYYSTGNPNTVIDDFRFDDRYVEWAIAANGLYLRYFDATNLGFCKITQGRKFRVKSAPFKGRDGDTTYLDGTLDIVESSSDEYQTIGAK